MAAATPSNKSSQKKKNQREPVAAEKKTEEASSSPSESDEAPDLTEGRKPDAGDDNTSKQSRSEKKARKAMSKLNLKPVGGICRVTIRKAKAIMFVISNAEVFKAPNVDTYIIFGEAKIEDMSTQAQAAAVEKLRSQTLAGAGKDAPLSKENEPVSKSPIAEESEDEEVDDTGLEAKDIELIMEQANVSRSRAINALRKNNNDIVNAIMCFSLSLAFVVPTRAWLPSEIYAAMNCGGFRGLLGLEMQLLMKNVVAVLNLHCVCDEGHELEKYQLRVLPS
ncbi:unnamed protein product [Mesocestoides corti]|uniref:NAC-A/B domain-containing protein n=1 Tax=Mesocestoides corti TaxID=53468 RepID=A0A0R3U3D3_MESCO|nr:unnamed protein product [Mesocestoides corti]